MLSIFQSNISAIRSQEYIEIFEVRDSSFLDQLDNISKNSSTQISNSYTKLTKDSEILNF